MGYGKRAVSLLKSYYEGRTLNLTNNTELPNETIASVNDFDVGSLRERMGKMQTFFILATNIVQGN